MEKLTDFFKMMSDETRFRIVMLLHSEKLCVCEICGILEMSQPKISRHLAKLRDVGLVRDERKEQFIYYDLNLEDLVISDFIQKISHHQEMYPVIKKDQDRLADKDKFLQACKIN